MSDQGSGASADNAGDKDSSSETDKDQGSAQSKSETVARADHERALKDLKAFKEKARALEAAQAQAKEAELKKNQEWQKLAEAKELEAKEARENADSIKKSYLNDRKYSTVREAAIKMGLRQEALSDLELLDLDDLEVESTSTGKINVLGADKFAERLKTLKPHWFGSKNPPAVDTTDPRVQAAGKVTTKQLLDAEKKARQSGDSSEYHALLKKYRNQTH